MANPFTTNVNLGLVGSTKTAFNVPIGTDINKYSFTPVDNLEKGFKLGQGVNYSSGFGQATPTPAPSPTPSSPPYIWKYK
jgi:hypothetical protein